MKYTEEETLEKVASCPRWYHQIDVGHGIITPGIVDSSSKLGLIEMPEDLTGWTVLDIGAADGYFSFEAERRGAESVMAVDYPHWIIRRRNFEIARKLLSSKVEDLILSVYDVSPDTMALFDLVLFMGVIYHLQHPTLGLENAVAVTKKMIIVETGLHTENVSGSLPMMVYTPGAYHGDPTNWWYPNPQCVIDMMKQFGCEEVRFLKPEGAKTRAAFHGYKNGYRPE